MRPLKHTSIGLLSLCLALGAGTAARGNEAGSRRLIRSPFQRGKVLPVLPDSHLVTIANNPHVTKAQYEDLSNGVQALLKRYHPDKHYFIGTGRDPAPIIAALEDLGGRALAMNFPASNIVAS